MASIMTSYDWIAEIDPRMMNLKYLEKVNIPYFHEYCSFEEVTFEEQESVKFKNLLEKYKMDRLS